MTAERTHAVVYALGGGYGHTRRAARIAARFESAVVLHQCPPAVRATDGARWVHIDAGWTPDRVRGRLRAEYRPDCALVVDAFPGGVAHELDTDTVRLFDRAILVRRYVRPGTYRDYDALAARFAEHWLPYHPHECEWDGEVSGDYVGPLVREVYVDGAPVDTVVIGDVREIPPGWRAELRACVAIDGPFERLPRAARYVSIGAGHNMTYELRAAGVDARAIPLPRRFDDQFRRADRLAMGLYTRRDLASFLGG